MFREPFYVSMKLICFNKFLMFQRNQCVSMSCFRRCIFLDTQHMVMLQMLNMTIRSKFIIFNVSDEKLTFPKPKRTLIY